MVACISATTLYSLSALVNARTSPVQTEHLASVLNLADSEEALSDRGPHQVDLELGRYDVAIRGSLRQRGVAAGAVEDARHRTGVDVAALLRQRRRIGEQDVNFALGHEREPRSERLHQSLGLEAVPNPVVQLVHVDEGSAALRPCGAVIVVPSRECR